jgi:hypothetical protein
MRSRRSSIWSVSVLDVNLGVYEHDVKPQVHRQEAHSLTHFGEAGDGLPQAPLVFWRYRLVQQECARIPPQVPGDEDEYRADADGGALSKRCSSVSWVRNSPAVAISIPLSLQAGQASRALHCTPLSPIFAFMLLPDVSWRVADGGRTRDLL